MQVAFSRIWASHWPEAAWLAFAVGNVVWMVLVPSWALLPYHLTWASLLLLYGLGLRSWKPKIAWFLVTPVMTATGILLVDPAIRGKEPYDELIELPVMLLLLFGIARLTKHRKAAFERLDALSRENLALLEQQREFVQNASHELRTPITIALAHAELIPRQLSGDVDPDVAMVLDELARMRKLVDRLLVLATAEQITSPEPRPTSLLPVLDETLRRWQATPRQWSVSRLDQAKVLVDADRLVVALDALLDNATRVTQPGDRIDVSAEVEGHNATITIADSGPGIPEAEVESVLQRFRRSSASERSNHSGNGPNFGLGLSIVRAVAESHGGSVRIQPSPLGGTAIAISLPIHEVDARDASVESQMPLPLTVKPATA